VNSSGRRRYFDESAATGGIGRKIPFSTDIDHLSNLKQSLAPSLGKIAVWRLCG
jgi:hypothetical protein